MSDEVTAEIIGDARTLSPTEFCSKHPYPFLLGEPPDEASRGVDEDSATTTLPAVADISEPLALFPGGIVPVRRRDRSPFATQVTVGRGGDADVQLPAATISKDHAQFVVMSGVWRLVDRASQNGCFVQGDKLLPGRERVLTDGDSIAFGPDSCFRFFGARTLYHLIRGFVDPKAY